MREKKYHLYLTADEQSKVIQSLIDLKNNLIAQGRYQEKLTSKTNEIPIWERQWLTIEEASEYSGIARRKLRELSNTSGCPFAIWMGNKIHIIREKLDRYTETHNRI